MENFSACSLAKSFQELYMKDCERGEGGADYTIECGDLEIPVHKFVLSARSSVLHTAMFGGFRENKKKKYRITDFKPDSVKCMVRFLYGFEVTKGVEDPEELLRLGDMYEVEGLKELAINLIEKNITQENVFTIIEIADTHKVDETFEKCVDFVKQNFSVRSLSEKGLLDKYPKLAIAYLKKYELGSTVQTFKYLRDASQIKTNMTIF